MSATKKAATGTRQQLILAAERLFSEQGIDAVSLRQINVAAGQRNSSAAHYHFGSKESLINAIYDFRMERVNVRRMEMLNQLVADKRDGDIRAIVETIVYPIVEEADESEGGAHYVPFMAQAMGHPALDLSRLWQSSHGEGLGRAIGLLRTALPTIPERLLGQRFGLFFEQIVHALADRERFGSYENLNDPNTSVLFVNNLVDCIAGGIAAPVSQTTLTELERAKKGEKPQAEAR